MIWYMMSIDKNVITTIIHDILEIPSSKSFSLGIFLTEQSVVLFDSWHRILVLNFWKCISVVVDVFSFVFVVSLFFFILLFLCSCFLLLLFLCCCCCLLLLFLCCGFLFLLFYGVCCWWERGGFAGIWTEACRM